MKCECQGVCRCGALPGVDGTRREVLKGLAGAGLVGLLPGAFGTPALAAEREIRIGFVSPRTGVLAPFGEGDEFVLRGLRKVLANGLTVAGKTYPVRIIDKDSQSNPNRAAEVAAALIKSDKVDLMLAASTADTVNPVADQCEINRVPCISTDCPWEPYFFGRGAKPDGGFNWTYHFFWGLSDLINVYTAMWGRVASNRTVGALWPNDAEGNAFADAKRGFPPELAARGFKLVDPGRFQPGANDFSAQIGAFKSAGVEILTGVLPPPAFATFWSQAAQQGFKPKVATIAKALLFPAAVETLGERGLGLTSEVWWSPSHPFKSGLTGESAAQFCAAYEAAGKRPWTQPLGFRHALFEVAIDVLKRARALDPAAIRDAIKSTEYDSLVGTVAWRGKPVRNVTSTPLVGGQWVKGKQYRQDLVVVDNTGEVRIPVGRAIVPLS